MDIIRMGIPKMLAEMKEVRTFETPARLHTKQEVLTTLAQLQELTKTQSQTSTLPACFYERYLALLQRFYQNLDTIKFIDDLASDWWYEFRFDEYGARLLLVNEQGVDITNFLLSGREIVFYEQKAALLTVEDYAALYDVEPVTVRQWLRRGKLVQALKLGNGWRIPELALAEKRAGGVHLYSWDPECCTFTEDLAFLNGFCKVMIDKSTLSKEYIFSLTPVLGPQQIASAEPKMKFFTLAEKERLELKLIEHPLVKAISSANNFLAPMITLSLEDWLLQKE